ncbi:hypothetical protein F5884DRAFT_768040 [Xylogone sp. PMI_703]|nr:hypothetical protein F5884DRAFT_768040 [Xylogone sp. PMI_703]
MGADNAPVPVPAPGDYKSIAAQYARAKALKEEEDAAKAVKAENAGRGIVKTVGGRSPIERLNKYKASRFSTQWAWIMGFFLWLLIVHVSGVYFFTKGFLLTRLVLDEKSTCENPPIEPLAKYNGAGTLQGGCWHPKTFKKAVVIIIDALRYDFTVPFNVSNPESQSAPQAFHNNLPFLYETAVKSPQNAFLLPFIADPPTTTLQRLKGLTTGTLPTFIDAGSNFAGTAIEEDNMLIQLKDLGKKIAHLGDDTWTALFPGYFEDWISRAYDSFNVWDLHTVDNGVIEHIFPLLESKNKGLWDVMFAHLLGVDHAGHRYGPNHPAMTSKLQQVDRMIRDVVEAVDEDTLLIVMGDHGMDGKGDHGGETDDEIEAALWMYSKREVFGRTKFEHIIPPPTAKIRPVNQIDLVPTLSLLLGLPIPFNNLGKPIEEAFAGKKGNDWENLAGVSRMTSAGIKRYQSAYYTARGLDERTVEGSPSDLWNIAEDILAHGAKSEQVWHNIYNSFSAYQQETLRVCRDLWARFDVPCMILGVSILLAGIFSLLLFITSHAEDPNAVDDPVLEQTELRLELESFQKGELKEEESGQSSSQAILKRALIGSVIGAASGPLYKFVNDEGSVLDFAFACGTIGSLIAVLLPIPKTTGLLSGFLPSTIWGWLGLVFTLSQSIGFASNSYTIWEDSILLFFISTFGLFATISSLRQPNLADRTLGVYHSILFAVLGWVASFSKLCREEQMPYCKSTYYASATTSTSAPWQLLIPFVTAIVLPSIIKSYYASSRSYEGFAPFWIGVAFRCGLFFCALFWTIDTADDSNWFPNLPEGRLKYLRVPIAQTVLGLALVAGSSAFGYSTPCVSISQKSTALPPTDSKSKGQVVASPSSKETITIFGYANTHGARYFLLVINILLTVLLVSKPMGAGALALMSWQILSLVEIIDLNSLSTSSIGPIMLALLGSFHFFKTGHQATLQSIQWEAAFIALHSIRYPWSPLLVALNTFGAQIIAVTAVPLVVLWKQPPRKKGLLKAVAAALGWHILYYAVVATATTAWAGWLRRHLMLFRIFSPKFMTAAIAVLVVDIIGVIVALMGVRYNTLSITELFGWGSG